MQLTTSRNDDLKGASAAERHPPTLGTSEPLPVPCGLRQRPTGPEARCGTFRDE